MKIKISILSLFLVVFMHCNDKQEDFSDYRSTMLVNINEIIKSEYALLVTQVDALDLHIQNYETAGDITQLENARTSCLKLIEEWNKVRAFNVLDVKYNLLHTLISSKANATKIEQNIIDKPSITATEVANLGADQMGLNTISYLLFKDEDLATTNNAFYTNTSRINYLSAVSEELKIKINSLENNWKTDYFENFLADNTLTVGKPLNEIFNQIIETITVSLKDLNQHILDNSYETFGYYSQTELLQIKNSVEGLQTLFNANGNESFSSYLTLKTGNNELSDKVEAAFNTILEDEVFQFNGYHSINTTQKERLKTELLALSALLSIDASNELTILVTISDTDGD